MKRMKKLLALLLAPCLLSSGLTVLAEEGTIDVPPEATEDTELTVETDRDGTTTVMPGDETTTAKEVTVNAGDVSATDDTSFNVADGSTKGKEVTVNTGDVSLNGPYGTGVNAWTQNNEDNAVTVNVDGDVSAKGTDDYNAIGVSAHAQTGAEATVIVEGEEGVSAESENGFAYGASANAAEKGTEASVHVTNGGIAANGKPTSPLTPRAM